MIHHIQFPLHYSNNVKRLAWINKTDQQNEYVMHLLAYI